jgi:hypothetical protein
MIGEEEEEEVGVHMGRYMCIIYDDRCVLSSKRRKEHTKRKDGGCTGKGIRGDKGAGEGSNC